MPKRSKSDTEIVGKQTWDELWAQSAPLNYPNASDLEKEGWKSISSLTVIWKCSINTARDCCFNLLQEGKMESRPALIGDTRMRGTVYRPIARAKVVKKR